MAKAASIEHSACCPRQSSDISFAGFGSFPLQNHLAMGNAGFIENRTDTAKTHLFIEFDHRHLRM
jgi:hypothetical protein